MNLYGLSHKYYCGVDLHSRTLYLCIVGQDGVVLLHRSLPCDPDRFLLAIAPFREDIVVAVECVYSWYWLADLCAREGIAFNPNVPSCDNPQPSLLNAAETRSDFDVRPLTARKHECKERRR